MSFAPYPSAQSPHLSPSPSPTAVPPYTPGAEAPPTREVPHFAPVRVRGGRFGPTRLVGHRRRAVAAGLAVTAAALVAAGPGDAERVRARPDDPSPAHATAPAADRPVRMRRAAGPVTAPVRIADAATVRLLRPGDRVDVIAAGDGAANGAARVVARGARVTKVPKALGDDPAGSGALVVLSVPRSTAARLAGASATARLAVTLW